MSNRFLGKIRKIFQNVLLKFLPRVLSVKFEIWKHPFSKTSLFEKWTRPKPKMRVSRILNLSWDRQACTNRINPAQTQGLHCLPLIQQVLGKKKQKKKNRKLKWVCSNFRASIVRLMVSQCLRINSVISYGRKGSKQTGPHGGKPLAQESSCQAGEQIRQWHGCASIQQSLDVFYSSLLPNGVVFPVSSKQT